MKSFFRVMRRWFAGGSGNPDPPTPTGIKPPFVYKVVLEHNPATIVAESFSTDAASGKARITIITEAN